MKHRKFINSIKKQFWFTKISSFFCKYIVHLNNKKASNAYFLDKEVVQKKRLLSICFKKIAVLKYIAFLLLQF